MKNFGAKWLALATVIGAAVGMSLSLNGCGDGDGGGTAGTTGGAGRGGTTGGAGRGGTGGGTAGTGGASAGRGGSSAGTGGATGGATAGTGGATGGTGGGTPCPGNATFEAADANFKLNDFAQPGNLAILEAGTKAMLAFDSTMGDPSPGSLKVDAPFSDYNQYVDIQRNLGPTMLRNWTGAKLHVRVKVASGGNPSAMNPMGIQPYVNTGATYNGYCGKYTNLVAGNGWNDYVLDLSTCTTAPQDPSMVVAFGVSIQAGNGSDGDGGVNSMKPTAAVIYIDTFMLEGSCAPTTGTGGAGGATGGSGGRGGGGGATGGAGGAGGATGGAGGATGGAGGATGGSGGRGGGGGATGGAGGATGGAAGGAGGATGGAAGGGTAGQSAGAAGQSGGTAGGGGAA